MTILPAQVRFYNVHVNYVSNFYERGHNKVYKSFSNIIEGKKERFCETLLGQEPLILIEPYNRPS